MNHKVIITGTTGMVGKGVLLECLSHPDIAQILLVSRKSIGIDHPKVKELIIDDFFKIDKIKSDMAGYDACFFCAGISSIGKSEEVYSRITYELTLTFANTFLHQNGNSIFCYVSGTGTDSSEKGNTMWARVKGKTENELMKLPFKAAYMFRPGYIQPEKGIKSSTKWYALLYLIFKPIYLILKHFPGMATSSSNLGQAMIRVLEKEPENSILGNKEINALAKF
jgi:nucleoside-diphosphate-sugar epimerase